jgi:hypothetical protein
MVSNGFPIADPADAGMLDVVGFALQDAGCADDAILAHRRDTSQVHVRDGWAVDLVLGKW